jgi:uncharacterized membrane protein YkoI
MAATERFVLAAFLMLVLVGAPLRAEDAAHPTRIEAAHQAHSDTHPARAEDAPHPARTEAAHAAHVDAHAIHAEAERCLNQKERRAETESGKLIRLSTAMRSARRRMPGTVVRARLCHGHNGLVYVLTVLARDGKVARITVDAEKGTAAGDH